MKSAQAAVARLVVLSTVAGVLNADVAGAADVGCTTPAEFRSARIVSHGEESIDRWPGFAALRLVAGHYEKFFCGAVAISEEWVLTAGHCIEYFRIRRDPKSGEYRDYSGLRMEVVIGVGDLNLVPQDNVFLPADVILHSDYRMVDANGKLLGILGDLALIRLGRKWTGSIAEIIDTTKDSTLFRVAGFGVGRSGSKLTRRQRPADGSVYDSGSDTLKVATVPQVAQTLCRAAYDNSQYITSDNICAGTRWAGEDSCEGDSGGPLMKVDFATACPRLVGVVSWGGECGAASQFGVYTRVAGFAEWLREKTGLEVGVPRGSQPPLSDVQKLLLAQLHDVLGSTAMRVSLLASGKPVPKTGDLYRITVDSPVDGNLILIDVRPDGQIKQVLPNMFSERAAAVSSSQPLRVPDPQLHGFDAFQVDEAQGHGQLIGIVVPKSFPYERMLEAAKAIGTAKDAEEEFIFTDSSGIAYLAGLIDLIQRSQSLIKAAGEEQLRREWGFGFLDYEHEK